ncbi:S-adenosyl-L-methionine-dependent methyltransferase [Panus rudis PR-1116 ss-1]|nr:S-adenosyl-L-methionine-dependent methyltransferase [Panus rudis PR-1116 ss-1]
MKGPTLICGGGQPASMVLPGQRLYIGAPPSLPRQQARARSITFVEDSDLLLPGEALYDDLDDDSEEDTIPIRSLDRFTIYRQDTGELFRFEDIFKLEEGCTAIAARGNVRPWIDDSDLSSGSEDEDNGLDDLTVQQVVLPQIDEVNTHHIQDRRAGHLSLDPFIYLRTASAWYILLTPSREYLPFYEDFWVRHRLCHMTVMICLEYRDCSMAKFMKLLPEFDSEDPTNSAATIGRDLTEGDLMNADCQCYIANQLRQIMSDAPAFGRALYKVPLISSILGISCGGKKMHVLQHKHIHTIVTERISAIAQRLFNQSLHQVNTVIKRHLSSDSRCISSRIHLYNPDKIKWITESRIAPHHYRMVLIDGVQYETGDAVVVEPGEDTNKIRSQVANIFSSDNPLADNKWFAKICYFFEKKNQKYFHAQWFQQGTRTILQETAHPNSLFLLDECDDLLVDCIFQKCNLRELDVNEDEASYKPTGMHNDFFTGYTWDDEACCFKHPDEETRQQWLRACKAGKPCVSCGKAAMEKKSLQWSQVAPDGFTYQDILYHVFDFVYLRVPQTDNQLYIVAQILKFNVSTDSESGYKVDFRIFGRQSLFTKAIITNDGQLFEKADEQQLFFTDELLTVDLSCIKGKAYAISSKDLSPKLKRVWLDHEDHYIVDLYASGTHLKFYNTLQPLPSPLKKCEHCFISHTLEIQEAQDYVKKHRPLRGLELFAGAGGLSAGLERSGFVKTKWAVELCPSAALSFQVNHPDCIVYNHSSNTLLQHTISTFKGEQPQPLTSLHQTRKDNLPSMPVPGEVDFIYGGPPCQSFSGANHQKRPDDIRSTLACNMLSYVEFYRPKYVLIENVKGFLYHKLQRDLTEKDGVVEMGMVKFVLRSLLDLGYQARFQLLQAGQYGAPQGRLRAIFWGARRDLPLPTFPIPTHCYPTPTPRIKLPHGGHLHPISRDPTQDSQCAPLPTVTVNDAISDLPKWDWMKPHVKIRRKRTDAEDEDMRQADGIAPIDAVKRGGRQLAGYTRPIAYPTGPQTTYQATMRKHCSDEVLYHYTSTFTENIVERVTNIPLVPNANHKDLPGPLKLSARYDKPSYRSLYARLDGNAPFKTVMTRVMPQAKGGHVLHPHQQRVLTVREYARCQGFPDDYIFLAAGKDKARLVEHQYRQIGNAVPVQLAAALGRELGKAMVAHWREVDARKKRAREESPEVESGEDDDDENEDDHGEDEEQDGVVDEDAMSTVA